MIEAPYGSWKSPITPQAVFGSSLSLSEICVDGDSVYHLESRPPAGNAIVVDHSTKQDVTPQGSSTRTRVHEYGGASYSVRGNQMVLADFKSLTVFLRNKDASGNWSEPQKVVPDNAKHRYADFQFHPSLELVIAVREDHTDEKPVTHVKNEVVVIDLKTSTVQTLISGASFYSNARFSSDGRNILWKEWNLPFMPWESSFLYTSAFQDGKLRGEKSIIAGGPDSSVSQPDFVGAHIVYLSDETGFNQPFAWSKTGGSQKLLQEEPTRDIGGPDWLFGFRDWCQLTEDSVAVHLRSGHIGIFSLSEGTKKKDVKLPYPSIEYMQAIKDDEIVFIGKSPVKPAELTKWNLTSGQSIVLQKAAALDVDPGYLTMPEDISFTSHPDPGTTEKPTAYAILYKPRNKDYQDTKGRPPCVLRIHGGPTSSAGSAFDLALQYYTSRGFAFVDVNYGGSTSYGKEYRNRLRNNWGITDVADSVACVEHLQREGIISKCAIQGGSSGGYTVLQALCHYSSVFGAGASLYGIADLLLLAADTHKFESQYEQALLGGTPETAEKLYRERSPINHVDGIQSPLIVLQGEDDRVVPKEQAEAIVESLKRKGVPVEYHLFKGEGHGWRQTTNKITSLTSCLKWYQKAFNISSGNE